MLENPPSLRFDDVRVITRLKVIKTRCCLARNPKLMEVKCFYLIIP